MSLGDHKRVRTMLRRLQDIQQQQQFAADAQRMSEASLDQLIEEAEAEGRRLIAELEAADARRGQVRLLARPHAG